MKAPSFAAIVAALFSCSLAPLAVAGCSSEPAAAAAPPPAATDAGAPSEEPEAEPTPPPITPADCEMPSTKTKPSATGQAPVEGADGKTRWLYWIKLNAKTSPARGTLFYLAGGPLSHVRYTDLAATFQSSAFPAYDVVLYDYYGFNCSSPLQDSRALGAEAANLTMPAMARDFIGLKRKLLGDGAKAYLMGGSHGAMLGAQIVADYPAEIARAVLFSGDTESGWLEGAWFRFDRLMTKLDAASPGFAQDLRALLDAAAAGKLKVKALGKERVMGRAALEVALWLGFGHDATAQAELPALVKKAAAGDTSGLASHYAAELALLEPVSAEGAPTDASTVTNFHRCNVWLPKSKRAEPPAGEAPMSFFTYASFADYWSTLCKDYDALGEHRFAATPTSPTSVPVLSWVGDQDYFDPITSRQRWAALSASLDFHVMAGWSHDFGPDAAAGFTQVKGLVKTFLAE